MEGKAFERRKIFLNKNCSLNYDKNYQTGNKGY